MIHSDIKSIAASFAYRNKTIEQYKSYFAEHQQGDRITLVAVVDEKVVGYINIFMAIGLYSVSGSRNP
jgi:hypothetical protein